MEADEQHAQVLHVTTHATLVLAPNYLIRNVALSFDTGIDSKYVSEEEFARGDAFETECIFTVKSEWPKHASYA